MVLLVHVGKASASRPSLLRGPWSLARSRVHCIPRLATCASGPSLTRGPSHPEVRCRRPPHPFGDESELACRLAPFASNCRYPHRPAQSSSPDLRPLPEPGEPSALAFAWAPRAARHTKGLLSQARRMPFVTMSQAAPSEVPGISSPKDVSPHPPEPS